MVEVGRVPAGLLDESIAAVPFQPPRRRKATREVSSTEELAVNSTAIKGPSWLMREHQVVFEAGATEPEPTATAENRIRDRRRSQGPRQGLQVAASTFSVRNRSKDVVSDLDQKVGRLQSGHAHDGLVPIGHR